MTLPTYAVRFFRVLLGVSVLLILVLATQPMDALPVRGINDKLMHALAFLALSWFVDFAFPKTGFDLRKILPLLGYGLLVELVQWPLSYRSLSGLDLLADAIGIGIYLLSQPLLRQLPIVKARWIP